MQLDTEQDRDWSYLTSFLPSNWQALGTTCGAIPRKLRSFGDAETQLRSILLHICKGYSLRETSARLKLSNTLNISDVGLMNALRRSELWLKSLCSELYFEYSANSLPANTLGGRKVRLVDGSIVKEQGKTGSQWRINYSFSLPDFTCNYFDIVNSSDKNSNESTTRYPLEANECIIADRGYSRIGDVFHVVDCNSDIIVRVHSTMLPMSLDDGSKLDLVKSLSGLTKCGDTSDIDVIIKDGSGRIAKGRICAIRKSKQSIEKSIKFVKQSASKKGYKASERSLELAKYMIIFTTIPKHDADTNVILDWYRVRWQVELAFKRLKSLAGLGHLPKYDEKSSRAWLYGKLLIGLLVEKISRISEVISPWEECKTKKYLA